LLRPYLLSSHGEGNGSIIPGFVCCRSPGRAGFQAFYGNDGTTDARAGRIFHSSGDRSCDLSQRGINTSHQKQCSKNKTYQPTPLTLVFSYVDSQPSKRGSVLKYPGKWANKDGNRCIVTVVLFQLRTCE